MTTRTSATSGNWRADDADTWGLGLNNYPAAGEHVVIDTGHTVTLGESNDAGSIKLIGTLAGGGGHTLTLNDGGDNEIFDHDGTITGTLNITITGTTNRLLDLSGSSGNVNNLIINASSTTFTLSGTGTHTVAGNLTISAGTLDTDSSNNRALTVAGNILIHPSASAGTNAPSTLTCNGSTITVTGKIETKGTWHSGSNDYVPDGNFNGGSATIACNSFQALAGGNITLSSGNMTIDGLDGGASFRVDTNLTYNTYSHGNGTVTFSGGDNQNLYRTGSTDFTPFYNLVINKSANEVRYLDTVGFNTTVANDMTITAGTFNTNESDGANPRNLTVAGNTKVTGTLTGNNSTLIFGTDGVHSTVEAGGLWVEAAGSLTFGSGDLTSFSGFTAKGTEGSPNVTSTGGGDILIKGRTNNGFMNSHSHQGVNITGDYIIDFDTNAIFDNRGGTTIACGNFIIKHDGRTYEPWNNSAQATFKIIGNMQITDGTFDTEYSGQSSQHLTVTGNVEIEDGGALTGNASDISMGSLATGLAGAGGTYDATSGTTTITKYASNGKAIYGNGPINHNSGTFAFTNTDNYGSIQIQLEGGAGSAGAQFNDVTFSGNSTYRFPYYGMGAGITVSGDLTISDTVEIKQWRRDMIINGKITINNGCEYDCEGSGVAGVDSNFTAGTLEVASGGTFKASSDTTTITTGGTVGGTGDTAFGGEGTFTHNNGTLILDSVKHRIPKGGTFYNLKLTGSQNTGGIYLYSDTMLPQAVMPDGTTDANYFAVLGTLEITDDEFRPYNADKVYIHNLVIGDGTGSANSAKFDFEEVNTFDGKVFVDNVTIHSDGQLLFGDGDETSATEGSSALNIYGAFRNLGGSVDIT